MADFRGIRSIEDYERDALIQEAKAEIVDDEKEKIKKQSLLGDFGRNFHGYISRPGQNSSQLGQAKLKKELGRPIQYLKPKTTNVPNPRVKRLVDIEKMRQKFEFVDLVRKFGEKENPKFMAKEIDPLLSKLFIYDSFRCMSHSHINPYMTQSKNTKLLDGNATTSSKNHHYRKIRK